MLEMGKQVCQETKEIPQILQTDMFSKEKDWTSIQVWVQGSSRYHGGTSP